MAIQLRRAQTSTAQKPLELYRRVAEESDDCYEELVHTLVSGYVVEQIIISGGPLPTSITHQAVYDIDEYPGMLLKKSRERFEEVATTLDELQ